MKTHQHCARLRLYVLLGILGTILRERRSKNRQDDSKENNYYKQRSGTSQTREVAGEEVEQLLRRGGSVGGKGVARMNRWDGFWKRWVGDRLGVGLMKQMCHES